MSLSRAVNPRDGQQGTLQFWDFAYALFLHLLLLAAIAIAALWQHRMPVEPLHHIDVMMISAKQLAALERQARHHQHKKHHRHTHHKTAPVHKKAAPPTPLKSKPKAVINPHPKPKPLPKPVAKPKPTLKAKPKPAAKPVVHKSASHKAVAHKTAARNSVTKKPAEPFDPFAPIESSSDVTADTHAATSAKPALADIAGKQLSSSEKEHYIAMMQAAVQTHWKVASSATKSRDPLVKMVLLPSGAVASVEIVESSGNAALDASLIRAIRAAAPFTLPQQQFEYFRENLIRFHLIK